MHACIFIFLCRTRQLYCDEITPPLPCSRGKLVPGTEQPLYEEVKDEAKSEVPYKITLCSAYGAPLEHVTY